MDILQENFIVYKARLEKALKDGKPFNTHNSSIKHATEIIANGFLVSREKIRLLSYKLDLELYGTEQVHKAVRQFLERDGTQLHVLIETDIDTNHPIISLCNEFENKTIIRRVPDDLQTYRHNFMTMDDWGYRFEYDREELVATASFYEESQESVRGALRDWFDITFDAMKSLGSERLN